MRKAVSLIFRQISDADFSNISGSAVVIGGGGQSYIDITTRGVSVANMTTFLGPPTGHRAQGPEWSFTINSLGLHLHQNITIAQRRAQSLCITSQKVGTRASNRVYAWDNARTGFPNAGYIASVDTAVIFIIKDDQGQFWAGWNYLSYINRLFGFNEIIPHFAKENDGYIILPRNYYFIEDNWRWPFIGTTLYAYNYLTYLNMELNTILFGPPGTGKTRNTVNYAIEAIDGHVDPTDWEANKRRYNSLVASKRIMFVTFHQSFTYEDFVQGIKPNSITVGSITTVEYPVVPGIFKQICDRAESDPGNKYVLIIDEINRGNIASIFGELITLIEPSKRKGADDCRTVRLPYSKDTDPDFCVPSNLYIIGTMNSADKSIKVLDSALRRRFDFIEIMPDSALPRIISVPKKDGSGNVDINLREMLKTINRRIEVLMDRNHSIGHSYFLGITDRETLRNALVKKIIPLLEEYFYNDYEKIRLVLGDDKTAPEYQIFKEDLTSYDRVSLFGSDIEGYEDKRFFNLNEELLAPDANNIHENIFLNIY